MVEVEQNGQKKGKWNGKEDVSDTDIPEIHQPVTISRGKEGFTGGQGRNFNIPHMANVDESSEENDSQRCTVILQEFADISLEQRAATELSANPSTHEDKKGNHNTQVGGGLPDLNPLSGQDLNPFLQVDEGHVKPEDITRKAGDISQTIARVGDGQNPMHNQRPASTVSTSIRVTKAKGVSYIPIQHMKAR